MSLGLRPAAKALGISHVALLRAEKSGRVKRTADDKFDVEACRLALQKNTNPKKSASARKQQRVTPERPTESRSEPVTEPQSEVERTYNEAVRQREWQRVDKDAITLRKLRGELVEMPRANAWAAGMIIKSRDELMRIAVELRDRLALETDPAKIEAMITERIRKALENLAEYKP